MRDDKENVDLALPSHAVEIMGLKDLPRSGDAFFVVEDEVQAEIVC